MLRWGRGSWVSAEPSANGETEPSGGIAGMPRADEDDLMQSLLRFERAHRRHSVKELRACFHDEALMESIASKGELLGADETAEALARAFDDGVYSIRDWRYEVIEPQVVLSWTGARHLIGDARMRDEIVCRLHVGRDGLMWRVKLFRTREEALECLEQHGPTLGLVRE